MLICSSVVSDLFAMQTILYLEQHYKRACLAQQLHSTGLLVVCLLAVKAQLAPLLLRHQLVVHSTFEVLLGHLATINRLTLGCVETFEVANHEVLALAVVVQREGALVGRSWDEELLAGDAGGHRMHERNLNSIRGFDANQINSNARACKDMKWRVARHLSAWLGFAGEQLPSPSSSSCPLRQYFELVVLVMLRTTACRVVAGGRSWTQLRGFAAASKSPFEEPKKAKRTLPETTSPNSPLGMLDRVPKSDDKKKDAKAESADPIEAESELLDPFARFPNSTNPVTGEVGGPTGRFGR